MLTNKNILREIGINLAFLAKEDHDYIESMDFRAAASTVAAHRILNPFNPLNLWKLWELGKKVDSYAQSFRKQGISFTEEALHLDHHQALSRITKVVCAKKDKPKLTGVVKECKSVNAAKEYQFLSHFLSGDPINIVKVLGLPQTKYAYSLLKRTDTIGSMVAQSQLTNLDTIAASIRNFNQVGLYRYKNRSDKNELLETDVLGALRDVYATYGNSLAHGFRQLAQEQKEAADYIQRWNLKNYCTNPSENYATEFTRRAQRLGLNSDSTFIRMFIANYIKPVTKQEQVLSHGDLHCANMFADGAILELDSLHIGVAGEDLAKLIVSSYCMPGVNGTTVERILNEQGELISKYNTHNLLEDDPKLHLDAQMPDIFVVDLIPKEQLTQHMRKCLTLEAFTLAAQNLKNYQTTRNEGYLHSARKAYRIFRSGLTDSIRHVLDSEVSTKSQFEILAA